MVQEMPNRIPKMERKGDWMKLLTIIYFVSIIVLIFWVLHLMTYVTPEPQIIKITTENGEVV